MDGGATLNLFFRTRIVILSLLALLALGAAGLLLRAHPALPIQPLIAAAVLAALSFLLLRHAGLVALILVAPLPGLLAAVVFFPDDGGSLSLPFAYLPGFALGGFFAAEIVRRAAEGETSIAAAAQTLKDLVPAALCALAVAAGLSVFPFATGWREIPAIAGAGLCAGIALPLGASLLPFGEDFAARANRLRERRERWLAALVPAAQPRWGWSLSGVAVVFAVLGFFGASPLAVSNREGPIGLVAIALAAAASFLATRDWRRTLAALLAFLPAIFLGLWVFARSDLTAWPNFLPALGLGFIPVLLVSALAARFARDGEAVAVASIRALERNGAAVLFLAAASALSLAVFHGGIAAALVVALGAPCALVFAPAFAVVLESIFPRRATIEARYRVR